jgi:hypothetical protein
MSTNAGPAVGVTDFSPEPHVMPQYGSAAFAGAATKAAVATAVSATTTDSALRNNIEPPKVGTRFCAKHA